MDGAAPAAALGTTTEVEYLRAERRSLTKNEWQNGRIVPMAGSSPKHNLIVGNVAAALKAALRGRRCLVLSSAQRMHIEAASVYTYPDVVVTCDRPQFHTTDRDSLTNPRVVVEVLSKSTEAYDRGRKFALHQTVPSFTEHVLVAQSERRVEHFRKGGVPSMADHLRGG